MIDLKRGFYILMANGSVKCRKRTRIKIIQKFLKFLSIHIWVMLLS